MRSGGGASFGSDLMATAKKRAGEERGKRKMMAALAVLLLALTWIIYYGSTMGGAKAEPPVSPEKVAELQDQHDQELKQQKQQMDEVYRGKNKAPAPSGS